VTDVVSCIQIQIYREVRSGERDGHAVGRTVTLVHAENKLSSSSVKRSQIQAQLTAAGHLLKGQQIKTKYTYDINAVNFSIL
jgi:hypothetical protein